MDVRFVLYSISLQFWHASFKNLLFCSAGYFLALNATMRFDEISSFHNALSDCFFHHSQNSLFAICPASFYIVISVAIYSAGVD